MKKVFLFLTFALTISLGFSQTYFGLRLGMNSATMTGKLSDNDNTDHESVQGIDLGVIFDSHFTDMFSLQYGLSYLQKGLEQETDNIDFIDKYNSVELPILFKATFGDKFKFYGNVGPYVNLSFGGKYEDSFSVLNTTTTTSGKIIFDKQPDNYTGDDEYLDPEKFSVFDYGFYFGGGVSTKLGPGYLGIDIRYGIGMVDFHRDAYFDTKIGNTTTHYVPDGYEAFKNRNLSIALTYMFGSK